MSKIEVIRVEPLELPHDIVWYISGKHHISMKDFYVYIHETKGVMYVNKCVPEKDIEKMIEVATSPRRYILDDETESGKFMDYVYETYGYPAYESIHNYHDWMLRQQDEQKAKEKVQSVIPSIEKMIKAGMYDEYMIHEAHDAGSDRGGRTSKNICGYSTIYTYCLGFLAGSGALKEKHSLEDSGNVVDFYYGITEMLEHIDIQEMPRIYGYLKEMYFSGESEG